MKEKLTNQQKLLKRKFHKPRRLFHWFYHLVMVDVKLKKHNPEVQYIDDIRKEKGGAFIIWNHLSRLDHAYINMATYPKRFNMVAAYNEFFRSHLATVFKLQSILPKKNFCVDQFGMKTILSMIKKGATISIAPEGMATISGYNERILPGLGKLLKHCKVPVYFYKFEGQSLAAPVFSPLYRDGGKTKVIASKLFTPDDLAQLTDKEIEDKIQTVFCHNDSAWQKEHKYKWDTKGQGCNCIHDVLYKCPICGEEFKTEGICDTIICHNCNAKFTMNEYLQLIPDENTAKAKSVAEKLPTDYTEWYLWERSEIIKEIRQNPNFSLSTFVKIGNIPTDHYVKGLDRSSEVVGEGTITFDHSGIHYNGTKNGEQYTFDLSYEQYVRLLLGVNTHVFSLYIKDEYYDFFPTLNIAAKLDLITQEMNRLHFTSWPPLPEHEYLYK